MKQILIVATIALLVFGLACRKAQDPNSNKPAAETNANRKTEEVPKASPAASTQDDKKLLSELTDTLHRFNTARNTGDVKTQEELLANEFRGDSNGRVYSREEWIDSKGLSNFADHKVENAELLAHTEFTASMSYDGKTIYNDGTAPGVGRYTVTFVKRDGRWQLRTFKD